MADFKVFLKFCGPFSGLSLSARLKRSSSAFIICSFGGISKEGFRDLLVTGKEFYKINIQNGDWIYVSKGTPEQLNGVTIEGYVYHPGTYEITETLTLSELINKTGGLKENALSTAIQILRLNGNYKRHIVFADIEEDTFNLDPMAVEKNISPRTKAIMAIDIFGHSADMDALMKIAKQHNLKVISDTAQAPGALYHDKYAGTLAHIGGYSLNYHKHIHTGEGGVLVTNDDDLAERMQLIRNHAEAVVKDKKVTNLNNMIGYNFRLGEMESAIGIEQLKKLSAQVKTRQRAAERLTIGLNGLMGLRLPVIKPSCTHVYYVYPLIVDIDMIGVSRKRLVEALVAEGVTGLADGYVKFHRKGRDKKQVSILSE